MAYRTWDIIFYVWREGTNLHLACNSSWIERFARVFNELCCLCNAFLRVSAQCLNYWQWSISWNPYWTTLYANITLSMKKTVVTRSRPEYLSAVYIIFWYFLYPKLHITRQDFREANISSHIRTDGVLFPETFSWRIWTNQTVSAYQNYSFEMTENDLEKQKTTIIEHFLNIISSSGAPDEPRVWKLFMIFYFYYISL